MPKPQNDHSSGQVILIVLLAMATIVTLGLSVVSRTVSDVSVSSEQEDALRAFSAAEAGIEEVIISNLSVGSDTSKVIQSPGQPDEIKYQASVDSFPEPAREYVYPAEIASGESATVWLKERDASGNFTGPSYSRPNIDIFWAKPDTSLTPPAIEISLLYQDSSGDFQLARAVVDPSSRLCSGCGPSKVGPSIQTTLGRGTANEKQFRYLYNLNFSSELGVNPGSSDLISMDIRMLYNTDSKQILGIETSGGSGGLLPAQGTAIESTGTSGESSRKVRVYQLYSEPPSLFNYAIFSKSGITK